MPHHRHSYRDYLALEEASNVKHEYLGGDIQAMAGGTPEHAALQVAVSSLLHDRLRGGACRVFSSDLRVRVLATGLATYPDVTVVCGELERDPDSSITVVNPTLVVEVLSDGTEEYDRGEKREHYEKIPSLREYLLVSQRERRLELLRRRSDGSWEHRQASGPGESLRLDSVACLLDLDAVYRGVL